jgi:hypothetical protein
MNTNQRTFARLAAQGATFVDAYDQVYGQTRGKRKNRVDNASRLAARPDVQAAIAEFERQMYPVTDLKAARQRMISNIEFLALNSPDQKVRLAASIDLRNYVDSRDDRERKLLESRAPVNLEVLMQELSELRDRQQPRTIELEAVQDSGEARAPLQQADDGDGLSPTAGANDDDA